MAMQNFSEPQRTSTPPIKPISPTLHMHNPGEALPQPPAYCNASYYLFHPSRAGQHRRVQSGSGRSIAGSRRSTKTKLGSGITDADSDGEEVNLKEKLKREFEQFHSENGVRTVMGSIGPVENGMSSSLSSSQPF